MMLFRGIYLNVCAFFIVFIGFVNIWVFFIVFVSFVKFEYFFYFDIDRVFTWFG